MAKFNAGSAIEAVEYDFEPYQPGVKGVIPEPTQGQVELFFNRVADIRKLAFKVERDIKKAAESDDEADLDAVLDNLPQDKIDEAKNEIALWAAELCSNTPTEEQIRGLPYRPFAAFVKFLAEEYGPKDETGSTPLRVVKG